MSAFKVEIMAVNGGGNVGARIKVPGFGRRGSPLQVFAWSSKGGEPEYTMGGFVCGRKGHTDLMKALAKIRDWAEDISTRGYEVWSKEQEVKAKVKRNRLATAAEMSKAFRDSGLVGTVGSPVPGGNGVWTDRKKRKAK